MLPLEERVFLVFAAERGVVFSSCVAVVAPTRPNEHLVLPPALRRPSGPGCEALG